MKLNLVQVALAVVARSAADTPVEVPGRKSWKQGRSVKKWNAAFANICLTCCFWGFAYNCRKFGWSNLSSRLSKHRSWWRLHPCSSSLPKPKPHKRTTWHRSDTWVWRGSYLHWYVASSQANPTHLFWNGHGLEPVNWSNRSTFFTDDPNLLVDTETVPSANLPWWSFCPAASLKESLPCTSNCNCWCCGNPLFRPSGHLSDA